MQFVDFRRNLQNFLIFSIQDIRKIEADFDLRRLSEWQDKGYVKKIRQGFYIFSDLDLNESALFLIANRIYSPSYVSLEMALSHYGFIPEAVYGITSVTSRKTENFKTGVGEFIYRRVKPELMFGYVPVKYLNRSFLLAEAEKAVLDFLYLNPRLKSADDFSGLRFNAEEFQAKTDMAKMRKYAERFGQKSLRKRVDDFLKYVEYA